MTNDRRVSEDEAREIRRRVARLQRAESRGQLAPDEDSVAAAHDPSTLPLEHVMGAGAEAGISADHVLLALAECKLADWDAIRPERWTTRWLRNRFCRWPHGHRVDSRGGRGDPPSPAGSSLYRRGLNLTLAGSSAGLIGGGGAVGGVAVGNAAAGLLGAASLAGAWSAAALGLLLGGGVGVWGYRNLYAGGVAKGDSAVRRVASAIATEAEGDAT
ncbi:MAG TPA: hypothetical protein VLA33_01905 [Gemmatimonadota bacterium]|nr:hypothetical protein [Gemmatimonadota bacterium]